MTLRLATLASCLAVLAISAQAARTSINLAPPTLASSAQFMSTPRPLLFSDLVPFDTERHRGLTLSAHRKNFAFAANAHLLPLTMAEVGAAMHHYPLVFVQEGDAIALVALTGLPNAGNRYVDTRGEWRAGTYIPAYVRGYPFIAVRPAAGADPIIAFDPNATDFKGKSGQPLVGSDGQPTEQLKGILAFHGEYQSLADRTRAITTALKAEGVLEEGGLNLQGPDGQGARINGFLVVNEARLRSLSGAALKRLMDVDALGLTYAHLLSMGNLGNLITDETTSPGATHSNPAHQRAASKSGE